MSSTTDAQRFPVAHRLGFGDLVSLVAEGEADRERADRAPYDEVRLLAKAGYGALRLPPGLGGGGVSLVDLVDVTIELAAADSNLAHVLRNHFLFVEGALAHERYLRRWSQTWPTVCCSASASARPTCRTLEPPSSAPR